MLNINEERAIYCLKAESEKYPEICNECELYGMVGCDHCFDEATDVAINALEKIRKIKEIIDNANQWSREDIVVKAQAFCDIEKILKR